MSATCYVTFGQRYSREVHPIDERVHPDGWFEFAGCSFSEADDAARRYFYDAGEKVSLFAFTYQDRPDEFLYPRGCLARIGASEVSL